MGLIILAIFITCGIYVQTRGKVQYERFSRRLTDHSNIMAPLNCLFYAFSRVKNTAYLNPGDFPELQVLQDNWQTIRDEALELHSAERIAASRELDDLGFNSFFRTGWKRFYLKWYGSSLPSARALCPKTVALIESIPNIKGAMFTMLPPGARLVAHRDPYAGSLRYHLGLSTPDSPDCFINVDGTHYAWKDGEAVMFDETFIHYAENKTDCNRIILFVDIKRPTRFFLVDWINELFSRLVLSASATKNMPGDKVGFLNKIFGYAYQLRILGKKLKLFNIHLYYFLQYALYALLIYWIFF